MHHTSNQESGSVFEDLKLNIFFLYMEFRSRQGTKGESLDYHLRCYERFEELIALYGSLSAIIAALKTDMAAWRFELVPDGKGCVMVILRSEVMQSRLQARNPVLYPHPASLSLAEA